MRGRLIEKTWNTGASYCGAQIGLQWHETALGFSCFLINKVRTAAFLSLNNRLA